MQCREIKKDLLDFINLQSIRKPIVLGKRESKDKSTLIYFSLFQFKARDIQLNNFCFEELQEFLREREVMSIIRKRKQQGEKKAKRNDEKTKKIFKKIMKGLLKAFNTKHCKVFKGLTSLQKEIRFYQYYFGDLNEDISVFYDPLKKKLGNSKHRSISSQYLAQLKLSKKFDEDMKSFCENQLIYEGLKSYSQKILTRFRENKQFLSNLGKSKSKFEWVKFELVTAVFYFLFIYKQASLKSKLP